MSSSDAVTSILAWLVSYAGGLNYDGDGLSRDYGGGVHPVITVLKY